MRLLAAIALVSCLAFALRAEETVPQADADARAAVPKLKAPSNLKFNSTTGTTKVFGPAPAGQALTADGTGFFSKWAFIKGTDIDSTVAGSPSASGLVLTADGNGGSAWGTTGAPTTFTGTLSGEVTGTQSATVVSTVGGVTAANMASGANAANAATNTNTPSTIVKRDASGNFAGGTFTGNTVGTHTGTATNVTGIVAIVNGGTGSPTQNFVDLTTPQSIGGTKNFTSNVGIGTNTPSSLLSLNSSNVNGASLTLTSGSFTSSIGQKSFNSPDHALQFINANATNADNAFTFLNNSNKTLLGMLANGSVGIGTATPIVSGTGSSPLLQVVVPAAQATVATSRAFAITSNDAYVGVGSSSNPFGLDVRITGAAALGNRAVSMQTTQFDNQDGGNLLLQPAAGNVILNGSGIGNVGIGTSTPTKALVDIEGFGGGATIGAAYGLFPTGTAATGASTYSGSLYASSNILAADFVAFSDERIKRIAGRSNAARDLATLDGIEVTDYTYIDTVRHGDGRQKKVIAQQVQKVYPQAVSQRTDVVPDIYQKAEYKDGWVKLATTLQKGERVRLIGEKTEGIHDVLEIKDGAFRTAFKPEGDKLFVYGREVHDFRAVDYDAIAMLNVSATQEIHTQTKALQAENAELKKRLADLEAKDKARDARLARIEKLLGDQEPHLLPAGFEAN